MKTPDPFLKVPARQGIHKPGEVFSTFLRYGKGRFYLLNMKNMEPRLAAVRMAVIAIVGCLFAVVLLYGASIKVLAPNGGEILTIGGRTAVKWQSTGVNGNVVIVLYKKGIKHSVISKQTENSGRFNWLIPRNLPEGGDYRIRIRSLKDLSINDFSDRDFTIRN